ncbi:uncharacterized protein LOC115625706 [Scaptodrosophila lebanonensis]|uniref:Uncharacterized protein LOC115625706 n=1 Tax=Drosophila lebanonensis TaxID=7225 RepID=A0A6J2TNL3_DROLE|nr:uncharacterized protein LOC115625706 [Scaptodrosophila lebanonensis]
MDENEDGVDVAPGMLDISQHLNASSVSASLSVSFGMSSSLKFSATCSNKTASEWSNSTGGDDDDDEDDNDNDDVADDNDDDDDEEPQQQRRLVVVRATARRDREYIT